MNYQTGFARQVCIFDLYLTQKIFGFHSVDKIFRQYGDPESGGAGAYQCGIADRCHNGVTGQLRCREQSVYRVAGGTACLAQKQSFGGELGYREAVRAVVRNGADSNQSVGAYRRRFYFRKSDFSLYESEIKVAADQLFLDPESCVYVYSEICRREGPSDLGYYSRQLFFCYRQRRAYPHNGAFATLSGESFKVPKRSENLFCFQKQELTFARKYEPSVYAVKKTYAVVFFELGYCRADYRLDDMERLGGTCHAALFTNFDEYFQMSQSHIYLLLAMIMLRLYYFTNYLSSDIISLNFLGGLIMTKKEKAKQCIKLFLIMFKIGLFTFGGGYAMIALLEREFVSGRKWVDKDEFLDLIAIAESTPGPMAINSATYVGYKVAGIFGALLGTVAVCIPPFFIKYAISLFFDQFMALEYVGYAFRGVQVCVIYLIASAGIKMLREMKKNPMNIVLISATALCMVLFSVFAVNFSSIFYIVIGGCVGLFVYLIMKIRNNSKKKEGEAK